MAQYRTPTVGEPAPTFRARMSGGSSIKLDLAAGRYFVLCFFGSATDEQGQSALRSVQQHRDMFDDEKISFFGVTVDPSDEPAGHIRGELPGMRFLLDYDGEVSRLYGALPAEASAADQQVPYACKWVVVDPRMRTVAVIPFEPSGSDRAKVFDVLAALDAVDQLGGISLPVPIIAIADVFEREFCDLLINQYETHGGQESGFIVEKDGKTIREYNYGHKRRADHIITDKRLIGEIRGRVQRRINPEIEKVFQFKVTRIERHLVGCYEAATGGHFGQHRDNDTKGTAHRRFAVSINLNDDFAGGEISFPEYGRRSFKMPPGTAVVFSCSLLHAVSPVTRGRRFAYLPFLYDEAAAKIREANNPHLSAEIKTYQRQATV